MEDFLKVLTQTEVVPPAMQHLLFLAYYRNPDHPLLAGYQNTLTHLTALADYLVFASSSEQTGLQLASWQSVMDYGLYLNLFEEDLWPTPESQPSFYRGSLASLMMDATIRDAFLRQELIMEGRFLEGQANYDGAVSIYEQLLSLIGPDYQVYYNLASLHHEYGEQEKAVEACEQAILLSSDKTDPWLLMGICYDHLEAFERAIDCYREVLLLDPDYDMAYYNMGVAFSKMERLEEALDAYQKVVELDPGEAMAWFNLGVTYRRLENYEASIDCYKKSAALDPF